MQIKDKLILLILALFLAGCATFGQMQRGLNALTGQNIQTAFDVFGYPSGKQEFGNDVVYYWQTSSSGVIPVPMTATTLNNNLGTFPSYSTTTYNQLVPVSYDCLIKLITDETGTIRTWEYEGNYGCVGYIHRLNTYCKESKPKSTKIYKPPIASNDKLSKLTLGMNPNEVKEILGKPYGRRTSDNIYRIYEYCYSTPCKETIPVIFKNECLIGWGKDFYNKLKSDNAISERSWN